MANPDRPRGFTPIAHVSGSPWTGHVRTVGVTNGTDQFVGDMLNLTSNLALPATTDDATFLGVAVGFGKKTDLTKNVAGAFDPANLNTTFYDDSANTHSDWVVYYVPARDMVFEVQSNADLDLAVGDPCDLINTAGSTLTGRSAHEVGSNTNTDFKVVDIPQYLDNDSTLANTRYWITVTQTETIWD